MTPDRGHGTRQSVGSKIGPPEGLNSAKCFSEGGPVIRLREALALGGPLLIGQFAVILLALAYVLGWL